MKAEIRHFFETASEKEKRRFRAFCNAFCSHTLNTIRIKPETARRQELGEQEDGN